MSLRTPLGRVLGLGAARDGTSHWWAERMTAAALVPLGLWFVVSLVALDSPDYASVVAWVAAPTNTVLLVLFAFVSFWHSRLGTRVVVEDYVHSHATRLFALVLIDFAHALLGAVTVIAVLRVSFGGGA